MNYLYRCGIGISTEIFLEILGSACSKARTFPGKTKKKAYLCWQFSARSTDKGNHPFCSSKQSVISFFLNGQEKKKKKKKEHRDKIGPIRMGRGTNYVLRVAIFFSRDTGMHFNEMTRPDSKIERTRKIVLFFFFWPRTRKYGKLIIDYYYLSFVIGLDLEVYCNFIGNFIVVIIIVVVKEKIN